MTGGAAGIVASQYSARQVARMVNDGVAAMSSGDANPGADGGQVCQVRRIVDGEMRAAEDGLDVDALARCDGCVTWIDLTNPDRATIDELERAYQLHPLIVEELTETHRTSDVRVFDGATFAVLRFPTLQDASDGTIDAEEVEIVIGDGFLVTAHTPLHLDLEEMMPHWKSAPESWRQTSSALLYALLRLVIDVFVPVVDHLNESLESLEHHALMPGRDAPPRREVVNRLFNVTEQITDLHNMAVPTMDMIHSLQHNSDWFSHEHGNAYTRDVLDDARHLSHRLEMLRDTAGRLFEMVNALITLHRADVEKQLTLVATIFLPLTLLSSYFGQNFKFMTDHIEGIWSFLAWGVAAPVLALAVILALMWKVGAFR
jgi:magnesium transporter